MEGFKPREELERELAEMRQRSLDIEQCHAEFLNVQKRYEQLLQSAPDAMVFVSKEAKIVLLNAQLATLFGYTEDELIGRDLDFLIPERYRNRHRENVAHYFEQPRVRLMGSDLTIYGLRKDGTEFPADISLSPLETDGGIVAVGAIRDITERKNAEDEKQRLREQMAEIEKLSALGRVAANVADEIRNPLTAVGGFARRLQKIADSEKEQKYANYIIEEVSRLEGILRDVLAFSRTRSPLMEAHDIREILDDALKAWEGRYKQQSITVQRSYGNGAIIRMDRDLIREAFERIIENALEAMQQGGTLSLLIEREMVKGVPYVRISIRDTGAGISAEKIEKIFEPFFSGTMARKGTGLGLPIAKSIIEEESGIIRVQSIEGSGTTVIILFPHL